MNFQTGRPKPCRAPFGVFFALSPWHKTEGGRKQTRRGWPYRRTYVRKAFLHRPHRPVVGAGGV
eukprot:7192321-Pyramimonas_sp.AAC.2